jgi:hypothetical protein
LLPIHVERRGGVLAAGALWATQLEFKSLRFRSISICVTGIRCAQRNLPFTLRTVKKDTFWIQHYKIQQKSFPALEKMGTDMTIIWIYIFFYHTLKILGFFGAFTWLAELLIFIATLNLPSSSYCTVHAIYACAFP